MLSSWVSKGPSFCVDFKNVQYTYISDNMHRYLNTAVCYSYVSGRYLHSICTVNFQCCRIEVTTDNSYILLPHIVMPCKFLISA
jgi:hypothetical protein